MQTTISNAVFGSWEFNPWVLIPIVAFGVLYTRGWLQLHRRAPDRFGFSQLCGFLRRTDSCCLCTLLTARRICRMAADRST